MVSFRSTLAALWLAALIPVSGPAQEAPPSAPLSVEEVVKMSQNGFAEDVIVTKIKKNGKPFDLSTDELIEIRKLGVSDNVIKYLLDPSQPYATPKPDAAAAAPKPSGPAKKYPDDPNAARVPGEPGLYRFQQNAPVAIPVKLLLGEKQGAGLGKVLMKKGKIVAYVVGAKAKVRVTEFTPVFYLRLPPELKGIEEVLLVALEQKNDRREIDMGPPGPKPELKPETMRQFDSLEVGAGLFKLTPATLGTGEYLFFLIGTADPSKGNYGKGYDFGVQPPEVGKKH